MTIWTIGTVKDRLGHAAVQTMASIECAPCSADAHPESPSAWLAWLEKPDAELVWARAKQTRWKAICLNAGISRATAHRRCQRALCLMAARLNGDSLPSRRGWRRRSLTET